MNLSTKKCYMVGVPACAIEFALVLRQDVTFTRMNEWQVRYMERLAERETRDEMHFSSVKNIDRLLPNQAEMSKDFTDDRGSFFSRLESTLLGILPTPTLESKWKIRLKAGVSYAYYGSEINTLHFYQFLIRLARAKTVLELGTYVGVSALYFADAVGVDGHVTTVELGTEFHEIAQDNFKSNGMQDRITSICGDGLEVVREMASSARKFDAVFLDAAKQHYGKMLEPCLECLAPGGILLVDDVFMQGDALNLKPTTEKGEGVRELLQKTEKLDARYSRVILPIGDGLLLITAV
jgi:predicted O-methyltransferase YrrM